jgi:hypothetical protein
MRSRHILICAGLFLVLSLLVPLNAHATSYTWTGTGSGDWATTGNWNTSGYPNSYGDQATINYLSAHPTVTLATSVLLGGGGTALTIGTKSTREPSRRWT